MKNIHTVYNSDRHMWENKKEDIEKPLSSHRTKENVLDKGEKIAEEKHVEHFIHGKDAKYKNEIATAMILFRHVDKNNFPY